MKNRLPRRIACLASLVVLAIAACNGKGEVPATLSERTTEWRDVVPREELEGMTRGEIVELGTRHLRWEENRRPEGTKEEMIEWFLIDQELREVGDWGLWDEMGYFDLGYGDD